jgi:Ca-activated chloride channel family protein
MKLFICTSIGLLLVLFAQGQVVFNKTKHHYGTIDKTTDRVVDFVVTNNSAKKEHILRAAAPREVAIRFSTKILMPDSSAIIRVKYNPASKGRFNIDIPVYLSNSFEAITLKLSGEVEEMPRDVSPECPDFSGRTTVAQQMQFELLIKVIDKQTRAPIPEAEVKIISRGMHFKTFRTDKKGTIVKSIPLGYYYFITRADKYIGYEFDTLVNRNNNSLLIELERKSPPIVEPPLVIDVPAPKDSSPVLPPDPPLIVEVPPVEEEPIDTGDFSTNKYAANNIVFVVDVSSSMRFAGKLDLLKASMIELTNMLRDVDRIAIVSYATNAEVIMESTFATAGNKEKIIEMIQGLEARGYTAGGKGIRMAYKVANQHFINSSNNQVIIATDGAFNRDSENIAKTVRKNKRNGVNISVVGIKNTRVSELSMREIAAQGDGRFVHIKNYDGALESLKKEIRMSSLKK